MSIWNDVWELFFPRCCLLCGKRLSVAEEYLCFPCLSGLPKTRLHLQSDNEIEKCLWGKLPIERATSFLYYAKGGDVRRLMYELKYYGNPEIGCFTGRWMAAELLLPASSKGSIMYCRCRFMPRSEGKEGIIRVSAWQKESRLLPVSLCFGTCWSGTGTLRLRPVKGVMNGG